MSNLLLRSFSENETSLKMYEVTNFIENGVDIVSDEAFTFENYKNNDVKVGDLLFLKYGNVDTFYYIDKVIDNSEFTFKSILEIFNQEVYLPKNEVNISLYNFINRYFVNNTIDLLMNVNYLDISQVDNDILNSKIAINIQGNQDDIYNAKDVIVDTILGKRLTFEISNDLNNGKIKLKISPQNSFNRIDLDNYCFVNLELPELKINANCIDIIKIEEFDQLEVSRSVDRYYLLNDNTLSTNSGDVNRVLPCRQTVARKTFETGETLNTELIARDKLIDTNNYNWTFELFNKNLMYEVEVLKVGEIVDLYKNGTLFRSVLTGIIKKENTTEFRFGTNRIDLIFNLNKRRF